MSSIRPITSQERQEQIQKELLALGLRMEPSLNALDGEGHALTRIADGECVDPVALGPEVLALAEEWSMLEGPNDDDQSLAETCR
jgi:hypothetical protein